MMSEEMIELNNELVTVGSYIPFISCELNEKSSEWKNKYVSTDFGVDIYTNSEILLEQLKLFVGKNNVASAKNEIKLFYSVDLPIQYHLPSQEKAQVMQYMKRADMAVNEQLNLFAVAGPCKFGSMISMAYGIRALHCIDDGKIGMHAAAILDKVRDCIHLITGDSGIGKTSNAIRIEQSFPEKYSVICDDWVEVNISNKTVMPISRLLGATEGSFLDNELKKDHSVLFSSFNKIFYEKNQSSNSAKDKKLGMILHPSKIPVTNIDQLYYRKINHHIPFINQTEFNIPEYLNKGIEEIIRKKISSLLSGYTALENHKTTKFMSGNYDENFNEILKIINI